MLQTYGQISSVELARRLDVTVRSVRRYITMLQDLGIPVESERGRYGGYRLRPGYKLPPLMFNNNEALVVTLGLLYADRFGLSRDESAVEGALAKIGRVLPEEVQAQVRSVQESTVMDDVAGGARTPVDIVLNLSQAVQSHRRVWIRYVAQDGNETSRTIDPYGLVLREGTWYAVGWCHLREALRVFRLDRIARHRSLSATFHRPPGFNARETVLDLLDERNEDPQVELLLHTTIEQARSMVSVISASLQETAEGIVMTCNVRSMPWLAVVVASMPWTVEVRRPVELMDELERLSARIGSVRYAPD